MRRIAFALLGSLIAFPALAQDSSIRPGQINPFQCPAGEAASGYNAITGWTCIAVGGGGSTNYLLINTGSALLISTGSHLLIQ